MRTKAIIWALLLIGALLRVWMIGNGGQGFTPDENRYNETRQAASLIARGQVHDGLTELLATGQHPGFMLAGLIPAFIELKTRGDDRIPAYFFGLFSELSVVLIWLCARRFGMSERAQFWAALLAVCSVPLLFYARHVYPYDLSMSLALGALYLGIKPDLGWRRNVLIGAFCGAAFLTYMAYWLLAGVVIMLVVLYRTEPFRVKVIRAVWITAGFLLAISLVLWIDRFGSGQLLASARSFSGTDYIDTFGNGAKLPWEYLYHAQPAILGLFGLGLVGGVIVVRRDWAVRNWTSPAFLLVFAVATLYLAMVVFSEGFQKFVVTGRVSRLLIPFLCLLTADVIVLGLEHVRVRIAATSILILLIVGSAVGPFSVILRQRFPIDFLREGNQILESLPPPTSDTYYRYVNVRNYVYEIEKLRSEPAETLLAADHPYQFIPYLYDGFSTAERLRRATPEQQMRLVKVIVPPAERVTGEPYGMVRMKVRLLSRPGLSEPLFSIGPPGNGDLFFIRYTGPSQFVIGLENQGYSIQVGVPIQYTPGTDYALELYCGSLAPADDDSDFKGFSPSKRTLLRSLVQVRCDGKVVLEGMAMANRAAPAQAYAGFNFVLGGNAGTAFSGEILGVERGGYPDVEDPESGDANGAVRIVARIPDSSVGLPEPLVVIGKPGDANLVYIRLLPGRKAKIGIEVWDVGSYESDAFDVDNANPVEIIASLPVFYPPVGDAKWGAVPPAVRGQLLSSFDVSVNGKVVLSHPATGQVPASRVSHYGENPLGGSLVYPRFTGTIIQVSRLPFPLK